MASSEASVPGLVDMLRERYPELSAGQRRIADFLVQQEDEAQFLTAAQLAARVGLSESGVVRFAQLLGFSGYPELRRAVCHDFRMRATTSALLVSGRTALAEEPDLIWEIARRDAALIQETAGRLDRVMLQRCTDAILGADQVFVTGHRASYALAEYLAVTLRQATGVGTPLSFGTGMVFDIVGSAKSGDVVVAISITPYSQQTMDILYAAKQRGLCTVAITDHPLGAPGRIADEVILFETELHAFTSSYVGVMTIIHILLATISRQSHARTEEFLTRVEPMNDAFHTRLAAGVLRVGEGGRNPPAGQVSDDGQRASASRRSGQHGT